MTDPTLLSREIYVTLDGALNNALMKDLLRLTVETSLHLPDVATLRLHDPDLKWIDEASLTPGTAVRVQVEHTGGPVTLFEGEIVELEPEFTVSAQELTVRCFNKMHRLSRGRHVRTFVQMTDEDIIKKVVQECGLSAGTIEAAGDVHPYVIQANETNLEFLKSRAALLGNHLFVSGTKVHCRPPTSVGGVDFTWGESLLEFRPRLSALGQPSTVTVRSWDPQAKKVVVGTADKTTGEPVNGVGKSGGAFAQAAFASEAPWLVTTPPVRTQASAQRLAKSVAAQHGSRFMEAEGVALGQPTLHAGMTVNVQAVGTRFSGKYIATSVTHTYDGGEGLLTQFQVSGLNAAQLLDTLVPPVVARTQRGVTVGIVTDNNDPKNRGQVKVKLPWLSEEHTTDWVRVVTPMAGGSRGVQFPLQVNDEVLVAFEHGDINFPYVLGGLWNGQDAPPQVSSATVEQGKVIRNVIHTQSGHVITFVEKSGMETITFEHAKKHKLEMTGTTIGLTDKNGNKIMLDSAANTLTIDVKGNASVISKANLTVEATGVLELKGTQVKINGAATVDVHGGIINLN